MMMMMMANNSLPQSITRDTQRLNPHSSDIILKDSLLVNQTLHYQTRCQRTISDSLIESEGSDYGNPNYYKTNFTQELTYDSENNLLNVIETINANEYYFTIISTSNIPQDRPFSYPFHGGWQHNYPKNDTEIRLNAQEVTQLICGRDYQIVLDFQFIKNENLKYGKVTIPTSVFANSNTFEVAMGAN